MNYKNSFLLLLMICLTSCLKESDKGCQNATTVILKHEYKADGPTNVLIDHLQYSSLYIYNDQGYLVDKIDLDQNQLVSGSIIRGLKKGKHTIVSWANIGKNTYVESAHKLSEAQIKVTKGDQYYATSDRLYFSKKVIDVPRSFEDAPIEISDLLTYQSAHINFRVIAKTPKKRDVTVTLTNTTPVYSFDLGLFKPSETLCSPKITEEGGSDEVDNYKRVMDFSVLRFKDDNSISIELRNKATNGFLASVVNLKKLMADNNISINTRNETLIEVELEFRSGVLNTKIKEWGRTPIIPQN